ncbi:MAG: hypothetical protein CSB55_04350 [Candidatus Cloacimonadota bacterium]|nr:MAG: hypothetical protein CSB55_04350 [Candidatus Cloacimonadota bacterium]
MVNATSICKDLRHIAEPHVELKSLLEAIAYWLETELGIRIFFCELKGRRWSFFAGKDSLDTAQVRYQINDKLGMIAEANDLGKEFWQELTDELKDIVRNF